MITMKIGAKYNWKNQLERLVYLGKLGVWHQFSLVSNPETVWCEVLESDMRMLEETPEEPSQLDKNPSTPPK